MGYIRRKRSTTRSLSCQRALVLGGNGHLALFLRFALQGVFRFLRDRRNMARVSTASFTQSTLSASTLRYVCAADATVNASRLLPGSIPTTTSCFFLPLGSNFNRMHQTPLSQKGVAFFCSTHRRARLAHVGINGSPSKARTGTITGLCDKPVRYRFLHSLRCCTTE